MNLSRRVLRRHSFTLAEVMVVSAIIAVLASATLFAMYGAMEQARTVRTQAQIVKINELIMQRWERFRNRKVPVVVPAWMRAVPEPFQDNDNDGCWDSNEQYSDLNGNGIRDFGGAAIRLLAVRDLLRLELPDRITDLMWSPAPMCVTLPPPPPQNNNQANNVPLGVGPPSLWRTYRRRAGFGTGLPTGTWPSASAKPAAWSLSFQNAECLYLIISTMHEGDTGALDFFKESEIGDTDQDGYPEILDAWGRPIMFIRWAPGFATLPGDDGLPGAGGVDDDGVNGIDDPGELGYQGTDDRSELQQRNAEESPDIFDALRVDPRWRDSNVANDPFMLYPLIFSAGPDGEYDIVLDCPGLAFAATTVGGSPYANDPYVVFTCPGVSFPLQLGRPLDENGDGPGWEDNITNHLLVEAN